MLQTATRARRGLRLYRVGAASWSDDAGTVRLRFGAGSRFSLRPSAESGRALRGVRCGPRLWFRDGAGRLLRAVLSSPSVEELWLGQVHEVVRPIPRPEFGRDVLVEYSPNSHRFQSDDGRLQGELRPELGIFEGTLQRASGERRVEGLWGRGTAVMVVDGEMAATFAVTVTQQGRYVVHGFQGWAPLGGEPTKEEELFAL